MSPVSGIILSLVTMPAVKPGEPICHIAIPDQNLKNLEEETIIGLDTDMQSEIKQDLATNFHVVEEQGSNQQEHL